MIVYENECCDCATPLYPCLGSACSRRSVPHYFCDECNQEYDADELYDYDDEMVCGDCLLELVPKISAED